MGGWWATRIGLTADADMPGRPGRRAGDSMMSSLFWRAQSPQALMADDAGAVGGERH
jgi:hypothetical protein